MLNAVPEHNDEYDNDGKSMRSYATGGRKKHSRTIGDFLKSMYVVGRVSAPEFQEGAEAQNNSGNDPLCAEVAKSGNKGKHRGNMSRDVISKLEKRIDKSQLYSTNICFWDAAAQCKIYDWCYFMLPHETIDHEINKTTLDEWVGFPNNSFLERTFSDWKQRMNISAASNTVAVGLWGDSARYNTRDSLFMLLFNVLSGVIRTRFWICSFSKDMLCQCGCKGRCTIDSILAVLVWSFNVLLCGQYPTVRDDGTPFSASRLIGDKVR